MYVELSRRIDAPRSVVWHVVSDVGPGFARTTSMLSRGETAGEGLGTERRCWDATGRSWSEVAVEWDPGRAYAFEVDTDDYPAPLRRWGVTGRDDGVRVTVRMEFDGKYGPFGRVVERATARAVRGFLTEILDSYERDVAERVAASAY
jgi:hypothetical protein